MLFSTFTFSGLPAAAELLSNSVGVVLPEETDEDLWLEAAAPALGERKNKGDTLSLFEADVNCWLVDNSLVIDV
jgi:hypothetical protein